MYRGIDHVGIGVADMERAMEFYGERLGFSEVLFDYSGDLPGLEELTNRHVNRARVVMLASRWATPLGPGRIKLVQVLSGDGPPPLPAGMAWGEVGICEVCVHARDVPSVHAHLVKELSCVSLMEPINALVSPYDLGVELSYVADPGGGKIELLEWTGLWKALPGPPRLEGVNHVAFGVSDMEKTRDFYALFGFNHLILESDSYFEPMRPWYAGEMPRQHIVLVLPGQGAGIEPVQLHPGSPDCRGAWGHLGPMEFAIGVSNLDRAIAELVGTGGRLRSAPQVVDVGLGEWRYAYIEEPDGLYVSLVESRY